MFLSTKCIMSTLVLFSIIFSSVLAADSGFYTTDPTRGQINWLSQTTGTPSLVYDTLLSFPTALGINQNLDIYFANTAPSTLPWITHTRSQTENTLVYSTPESDTFAGSLIDGIAIDGSELFYLVANVPLTNEYADYPLIVSLDQSTSEASNVLSYSTNGFGFAYPTSLALDYENDHVYFTSMRTSNGSELLGEIYKLEYDGSDLENVWSASFAPSTHARIFSLQYSNHSLFFIDTSPQLDIKRFYIDYNTTSSVFASPSTISAKQIYIPQDSTTIYVLDTEGDIYVCLELSCDPITLRFSLGDTEVEDFAVDEATQTVYYISRGVSAVQFATQTSSPSVVSIGLSIDSQIWADTLRGRVYYGTNNVVNSISTQGSSWHFSRSFNDNIDILAGDLYTGNLIVSFQSTPGVWYSTGSSLSQLYTGAVTALTVKNRVVYFAAKDDNSILQCAIPTNGEACTATAVVSSVSGVTSVSVGMDGSTLYYALSNATYSVSLQAGQDPAVLFNTVNNIKPFAVASIDSSILFLDSPVTGGLFLRNCSYPLCVIPTLLASRPQSAAIGPRETGWIAVDAVNRFAYWSASTLRDEGGYYVAQTPLDTRSPTTYLSVGSDPITGLSWNANSSTLYVSLATNILLVHSNGNNETCTATVSSSKRNNVIGALAATQDSLYWSEFGSGAIYQCSDACDELTCTSSSFEPASGTRYNCARLQFLTATPTGDYIYNQYNCGGINKVSSAGDVTTLKTSDGFPITSLTIANDGRLVYALPYRATISVGTESAEGLSEVGTYFSGTGDISDLYVDDSKVPPLVYWVNKEGASLMVYDNQTFTDYNPLSVGSFVYVRTALVTVSPTFTRSVSASPAPSFVPESATPTPSVSASIDASIAASVSASASGSGSATATATATASAAPTTSASATASQLLPGESPSSTPTPSSTVSDSATASESASASFDNSPSTTPTPPSVSNTPGIAELGEQDESPIIGRTGWEVIIFLSILITVLCIIPLSCLCWRKNTAAEMALSLRLPDGDEI